ncbi:MAG: homoserine kinase [Thermoplasmata archaeon]
MITVISCASSANLGPGYDSASIALNAFHEILDAEVSHDETKISIAVTGKEGSRLMGTPQEAVAKAILHDFGSKEHIKLISRGNIPWGSGLGSSGACSVATVLALNELLGLHLSKESMVKYAAIGEHTVTGTAHLDNVIASLVGGLVLIESLDPPMWHKLSIHPDLKLAVVNIHIEIGEKTRNCRAVVPEQVKIGSAVANARNLSMLILGLKTYDPEMIMAGMNDEIVEPARSAIYPFYPKLKKNLLAHGALGVALSGAGPSVLCVLGEDQPMDNIRIAAQEVLGFNGIPFDVIASGVCGGAVVAR